MRKLLWILNVAAFAVVDTLSIPLQRRYRRPRRAMQTWLALLLINEPSHHEGA